MRDLDPIRARKAVRRARVFRRAAIIWILGFFDILSYATGKEPLATGLFSVALVLYVIYLIS